MSDKIIYDYACIYKLESADGSKVYYGSTKDFKKRMIAHKSKYKMYLAGTYCYTASFDIIKDPGYKSSIIETFKKISKKDLEAHETRYIQSNKCINMRQSQTKEDKARKMEEYKQQHREIIREKQRQKTNCACGGRFSRSSKARHNESKIHKQYLKSLRPIIQNITNNFYISKSGVKVFIKK